MPPEQPFLNQRCLTRLFDAWDAAFHIANFIDARSRGDYFSDDKLQSAVKGKLDVLATALDAACQYDVELIGLLPDIHRITDLRHRLIAHYYELDEEAIWEIGSQDIPPLVPLLRDLLNMYGDIKV